MAKDIRVSVSSSVVESIRERLHLARNTDVLDEALAILDVLSREAAMNRKIFTEAASGGGLEKREIISAALNNAAMYSKSGPIAR